MTRAVGRRGEGGAALVLALVFVTAIACIGLAAFDIAGESFREDRVAQTARTDAYAAAGALDTLVNAMRADGAWGRAGGPCAGLSFTAGDGTDVVVSCAPVPGSGALIVGGLGARADRVVDLTAMVGSRRVAHARVDFVDAAGSAPGQSLRVRNWTAAP